MLPPISSHLSRPSSNTLIAACMATSKQLISESFSHRWPTKNTKSSSSDEAADRHLSYGTQQGVSGSFTDMAAAGFIPRRWTNAAAAADGDFDFKPPQSEPSLHADQIFSKGFLLPLHGTTSAPKYAVAYSYCLHNSHPPSSSSTSALLTKGSLPRSSCSVSSPTRPAASNSLPLFHSAKVAPNSCSSIDVASKSWKLKLHFFGTCVKSSRKTLRRCFSFVIPSYKKVKCLSLNSSNPTRNCSKDSARSAPRSSNSSFSNMQFCRSNADISIHDAILHCKKSIGLDGD